MPIFYILAKMNADNVGVFVPRLDRQNARLIDPRGVSARCFECFFKLTGKKVS